MIHLGLQRVVRPQVPVHDSGTDAVCMLPDSHDARSRPASEGEEVPCGTMMAIIWSKS